jgi:hypothetical protein
VEANRSVAHLQGLYTVVVGVALSLSINRLVDQNAVVPIRVTSIPYFVIYLVTLVPICHGALRHLDVAYLENVSSQPRAGALMIDWSLLFVESCGLLALAVLISRPEEFSYVFAGLLAFDALWAFGAHLAFTPEAEEKPVEPRERPPEQKWAIINFVAVLALLAIMVALHAVDTQKPVDTYRWILIVAVALARTVWDYSWCWNFYYPKRAA